MSQFARGSILICVLLCDQVLHHALMKEASALNQAPAAAAAAAAGGLDRQGNGIAAGFGGQQVCWQGCGPTQLAVWRHVV